MSAHTLPSRIMDHSLPSGLEAPGDSNQKDDHSCDLETIAYLIWTDIMGIQTKIPIEPGHVIVFGRAKDCDVSFDDPEKFMSKRHFKIYSIIYEKSKPGELSLVPPLVYCEDLESSNGTFVNTVLIGRRDVASKGYLLNDGDIIEVRHQTCPTWKFAFIQNIAAMSYQRDHKLAQVKCIQDRFTISDRLLGSGQYGSVYLATEGATLQQLACKIIDFKKATFDIRQNQSTLRFSPPPDKHRLMREIDILASLSHPHIVEIKNAFYSDSALDLAPNGDLFSYVDSKGGLLEDHYGRAICRQIVLGLKYIHGKNIVHRDVKPENVLIMETGFGGRVVLTDFGFANYVNKSTGRLVSKLGTEGFIAPEVVGYKTLFAPEGYTAAADLWSLGVLTVYVLTGEKGLSYDRISEPNQEDVVGRFGPYHDYDRRWPQVRPRASDFMRKLLVLNPGFRMTAFEALSHAWFEEPLSEAMALKLAYRRVIRGWKARDTTCQVIERLPTEYQLSTSSPHREKRPLTLDPKRRRRTPDTTLSSYFSLDDHLQPRRPSTRIDRKDLVDQLKSVNHFLSSKEEQRKGRIDAAAMPVKFVHGRDMFLASGIAALGSSQVIEVPESPPIFPAEQNSSEELRHPPHLVM